jgi:hypothetical protein
MGPLVTSCGFIEAVRAVLPHQTHGWKAKICKNNHIIMQMTQLFILFQMVSGFNNVHLLHVLHLRRQVQVPPNETGSCVTQFLKRLLFMRGLLKQCAKLKLLACALLCVFCVLCAAILIVLSLQLRLPPGSIVCPDLEA